MSTTATRYIACDLGAESGRVILGTLENNRLVIEEIHRFPTGASRISGSLRWDLLRIFDELKTGLRKVAAQNIPVAGISVDSWGVDYVLFNSRQPMLSLPYHYRDVRTERVYSSAIEKCHQQIFDETGIQFMPFNTLYQLIAEVERNPDLLAVADGFLNIADHLNYLFSGTARAEQSLASTTQIYNTRTAQWSAPLMREFNIPAKIFPEIVPSGTKLGPLLPELRTETNLPAVEMIATCSHDTGAAVAAVPAVGENWAYLSSGTWSLIGVELPSPLVNDASREANFTNEVGFGGTIRFLKNIVGLWILQESRREWSRQGQNLDYAEINRLAAEAEPLRSLINPNAARFVKPEDMPGKIADYCRETGQPAPATPGQFARCILESLALMYRRYLEDLERLTGRRITRLHIVGGGSQSVLLNQFAANATGRTVLAGPVEATAIGNVLIQAIATGNLGSIEALREVVRTSFPIETYEPGNAVEWQNAVARFSKFTLNT